MKCIYLSIAIFLPLLCWSQLTLKGRIVDAETQQALQYVNVGVIDNGIGTVSNANGDFELEVTEVLFKEIIRISSIGYETLNGTVGDYVSKLKKNPTVYLKTEFSTLEEVVLTNKPKKRQRIGNKYVFGLVTLVQGSPQLGNEIGSVIKVKNKITYLEKFSAGISVNSYGKVKFRLKIYNLKKGRPNTSILKENIIIETNIKKGKLSIDLKPYHLVMEEDFFVSLELIDTLENKKGSFIYSAGFLGTNCYYRDASQDLWTKSILDASISFVMTVKQ